MKTEKILSAARNLEKIFGEVALINLKMIVEGKESRFYGDTDGRKRSFCVSGGLLIEKGDGLVPPSPEIGEAIKNIS